MNYTFTIHVSTISISCLLPNIKNGGVYVDFCESLFSAVRKNIILLICSSLFVICSKCFRFHLSLYYFITFYKSWTHKCEMFGVIIWNKRQFKLLLDWCSDLAKWRRPHLERNFLNYQTLGLFNGSFSFLLGGFDSDLHTFDN